MADIKTIFGFLFSNADGESAEMGIESITNQIYVRTTAKGIWGAWTRVSVKRNQDSDDMVEELANKPVPMFSKVQLFNNSGQWTVPVDVTTVIIEMKAGDGGNGGYGGGGGAGGLGGGGEAKTVLVHTTPKDILNITVGKNGANGTNGGGPGENEGGSGGGGGAGGENTLVMLGDKVLSSTVGGGGGGGGGGRTIKNTGNGGRGGDGGGCGGYAGGGGKAGQHYNSNMQTIAGGAGGAGKAGGASSALGGGVGGIGAGNGGVGMGVPCSSPMPGYVKIYY